MKVNGDFPRSQGCGKLNNCSYGWWLLRNAVWHLLEPTFFMILQTYSNIAKTSLPSKRGFLFIYLFFKLFYSTVFHKHGPIARGLPSTSGLWKLSLPQGGYWTHFLQGVSEQAGRRGSEGSCLSARPVKSILASCIKIPQPGLSYHCVVNYREISRGKGRKRNDVISLIASFVGLFIITHGT